MKLAQAFLRQFLSGQRRPQVRVAIMLAFADPIPMFMRQTSIALSTTRSLPQSDIAFHAESLAHATGLSHRQAHQLRRRPHRHFASLDSAQRIQTNPLIDRHSKFAHPAGIPQPRG